MNFSRFLIMLSLLAFSANNVAVSDQFVVIVSSSSDVTQIDRSRLKNIYLGKATVFDNEQLAIPVQPTEGDFLRQRFLKEIVEKTPIQYRAYWARMLFTGRAKPPQDFDTDASIIEAVKKDPNVVGYISRDSLNENVRVIFSL